MRLRTLLIAAGIVVALPIAGLAIFAATFDANAYKPRIAAAVEQATGRQLALDGPIRLKLGLSPGVRVEDVAFANAPWGSRPEMARLRALEVEVAVLPLLSGRIEVNRVVLVAPDILLETNAEGAGNWEFAAAEAARPPAAPAPAPPSAPAEAPRAQRDVLVRDLAITEGRVTWRDGRTRQTTTLALPRLSARADGPTTPLSLDLEATLNDAPVTLSGTVGPLARLAGAGGAAPWPVDLALGAAGARATVKGTVAEPRTGRGFDLAVEATVPDLARLAALAPGVTLPPLRGLSLSVQAADRGGAVPEIRALTLRAGESDLSAFAPGLRLGRAELVAADARSPIRLSLAATSGGAPVTAEGTLGPLAAFLPGAGPAPWPVDLRLGAAGAEATAKGRIAEARAGRGVDLALAATIPDLAALAPLAGGAALPAIRDVRFSARARDLREGQGGELRDIALTLGPSDLAGAVSVALGARPRIAADLRSDRFDLDEILAALDGPARPAQGGAAPATTPAQAAARTRLIPDTPLPFDALRLADAAVTLAVARLTAGGIDYRSLAATLRLDDGRLAVDPFRVTAPGAPLSGRVAVDASAAAAPVALVLRAPAIDLAQVVGAFGGGYRVSGTLELDADVRGRGASPAAIAGTLDGHVGLAGANLDIDNRLIDLVAGEVWRALVPGAPREGSNNVRGLAFRFDSAQGVAEARAFLFDSALAKVAGTGSVLLGPEQLRLRAVPTLKLAGGGIGVPVLIGGTFLAPAVRVDAAGVAAGVAGALGGAAGAVGQGSPLGALAGALGGRAGAAPADDCPAQLAIARGGRQGPVPAAEAAPAAETEPAPPAQPPAQQPERERPANPLQQLLPRLGR